MTNVWPVAGTQMVRWYFDEKNSLSTKAPGAGPTEDRYTINYDATTGEKNRWHTQVGGEVIYPDRAEEDKKLLTYTSEPLEADVEITGHPIVDLFITSTHTDGAFYVYLEAIDEKGKVTYLTEGQLRAIHRRVSNETVESSASLECGGLAPLWSRSSTVDNKAAPGRRTPGRCLVPHHTFLSKDALPLEPGEIAELRFGLQPISVVVKKGHRLRVAIAGHDNGTFIRVPAKDTPTIAVQRNKQHLSSIELPIIKR